MPGFPSSHKPMPRLAPVHAAQSGMENYGKGRGGRPWRRKRDAAMARDKFMCQPCQRAGRITLADEVDHIIPQAEGGTDDPSNLQAICEGCHVEKTKAEAARGANRSHPRRARTSNASDSYQHPRGGGSKV